MVQARSSEICCSTHIGSGNRLRSTFSEKKVFCYLYDLSLFLLRGSFSFAGCHPSSFLRSSGLTKLNCTDQSIQEKLDKIPTNLYHKKLKLYRSVHTYCYKASSGYPMRSPHCCAKIGVIGLTKTFSWMPCLPRASPASSCAPRGENSPKWEKGIYN